LQRQIQQTLSNGLIGQNVKRRELCVTVLQDLNQRPTET